MEQGHHIGYLVGPAGNVEAVAEGKEAIARVLLDAVSTRLKLEKA